MPPEATTSQTPAATNNTTAAPGGTPPAANAAPSAEGGKPPEAAPTTPPTESKTSAPPPPATSLLAGAKESNAPEKYDLKLPEGVSADTKLMEGFEPLAKELGLSNDNAQKLVNLYAQHVDTLQKAQVEAFENQRKEWVSEVQKDPKYQETLSFAKRGLMAVATPEAQKLFQETWMGDHPAVIAMLAKVGRMLAEHPIHNPPEGQAPQPKDPASVLYPGLVK